MKQIQFYREAAQKEKLQRYMMENKDIVKHFYEVIVSEIQ